MAPDAIQRNKETNLPWRPRDTLSDAITAVKREQVLAVSLSVGYAFIALAYLSSDILRTISMMGVILSWLWTLVLLIEPWKATTNTNPTTKSAKGQNHVQLHTNESSVRKIVICLVVLGVPAGTFICGLMEKIWLSIFVLTLRSSLKTRRKRKEKKDFEERRVKKEAEKGDTDESRIDLGKLDLSGSGAQLSTSVEEHRSDLDKKPRPPKSRLQFSPDKIFSIIMSLSLWIWHLSSWARESTSWRLIMSVEIAIYLTVGVCSLAGATHRH